MGNVVILSMREAVCGKMTQCEYVQSSRQGSPMQWFVVGHMTLVVTFSGSDSSFPITNFIRCTTRGAVWVSNKTTEHRCSPVGRNMSRRLKQNEQTDARRRCFSSISKGVSCSAR